jgi:hypothetical protein
MFWALWLLLRHCTRAALDAGDRAVIYAYDLGLAKPSDGR